MTRILFFVPFGSYGVHNQLDAIFAAKLRLEGAAPLIVRCDGIYEYCDVLAWSGNNSKQDCCNCAESGNQLFDSFQLPCVQLRDYLTNDDYDEAERWVNTLNPDKYLEASYETLPIGQWVISSIFSYFRIADSGLAKPEVRNVHKSFLKSGLLTHRALSRIIAEFIPQVMLIFNARFAPYRVAFELSQRLGIHAVTHERGFCDDSFILFDNSMCTDTKPIFDISDTWKDTYLSSDQLIKTQLYLQNRENGLDMNYPAFCNVASEHQEIRHVLRIPVDAKVLAVFTSSEFELASSGTCSMLTTQLDRLDQIIELYRTREDYLVIRHHPHIAGSTLASPEYDLLKRAYQQAFDAPDNVRIIMPSETINSYSLLWNIDAAISFFSSIGYEAAGRGIGVAALSQAFFCNGIQHLVCKGADELNALIEQLYEQTNALDMVDLRKAFRFIYALIYRLSVQFSSFGIKNNFEKDIRIDNIAQLEEGFDPELDLICNCVLNNTPVNKSPNTRDNEVSPKEEELFFDDYIATIRRQRHIVSTKSRLYSASRLEPDIAVVEIKKELPEGGFVHNWIARSRYKKFVRYRSDAASQDPLSSLSELIVTISSIKEEYILISLPTVYCDESFVSSAVEILLKDTDLEVKGIFSGAWLLSKDGIIENEVFTKKVPGPEFSNLVNLNPEFSDPLLMCSLTLFRKNSLLELIDYLKGTPVSNNAEAVMAQILNDPGFHKTLVPLVLIKSSCHYGHQKLAKVI